MALTSGTKLGHYEIQSPLGAGGMGEVYRATDAKLGRDGALKVILQEFAQDLQLMAAEYANLNSGIASLLTSLLKSPSHVSTKKIRDGLQSIPSMAPAAYYVPLGNTELIPGLKSDSGRSDRIRNEKRAAGQEIEDRIMLFAAATGGRSRWRRANVNEPRKRSSSYQILNNRNLQF